MTIKIIASVILILIFACCNNNRTQEKPTQETPKALQDNTGSYELTSKRGYDNLIESLYSELVNKNIDLKKLEEKIDELNKSKRDSSNSFYEFNEKNQSYFNAANTQISGIKDSLLKDKMKLLIAANLTKYNSTISKHNDLLKMIEAKNLSIADLHTVLKIVKTLPLIDHYQKENLPNIKSLEGYIKQQDEVIQLADTLSKK